MPEVLPGNEEVLNVYMLVKGQHIMGFNGPVDINIIAIKTVMDLLGIEDQQNVFNRVYKIYNHVMSEIKQRQEAETIK